MLFRNPYARQGKRINPRSNRSTRKFVLSPLKFWVITLLMLLFPLSMNWRLILHGEITTGIVAYSQSLPERVRQQQNVPYLPIVEYRVNGQVYEAQPPENVRYRIGKMIRVLYLPEKPSRYMLLSFSGIFLDFEVAWAGLVLLLWLSFFFSFGKIGKKGTASGKTTSINIKHSPGTE